MGRVWLVWGCLFCGLSVALGAFAAHALKGLIEPEQMGLLATANQYMTLHALALLILGLWNHWEKWSKTLLVGLCFLVGILLFCGSLYAYVFTGLKFWVRLTPLGGGLFILGWILFSLAVIRAKSEII